MTCEVTGQKRYGICWKEIADGKLSMPREPRTLYADRYRFPRGATVPWLIFRS